MMSEGKLIVAVMKAVEGKSTVMVMEAAVRSETTMSETGLAAAVSHAHATTVAHATAAAAAATTMATVMGRHRDHRTGCECRRGGQRDHYFTQHDLTSMCGADHQLWPELRA
jgi:hypothetical protein